MSPSSRGRKRPGTPRSEERHLHAVPALEPDPCDCPTCSGFDPVAFVEDLVATGDDLVTIDDPLEAELLGASVLAAGEMAGEDLTEPLAQDLVPALERVGTPGALAVLLALEATLGSIAAAGAVQRLTAAAVPPPPWQGELSEPAVAGACRRFTATSGGASVLLCSFDRAGRSHGFMIHVDHADGDAAYDIVLFPGELLGEVVDSIATNGLSAGLPLTAEDLDPAEFRRQVESALDARTARLHGQAEDPEDDEAGDYHMLAALLRARLRTLPEPPRPTRLTVLPSGRPKPRR